MQDMFFFFGDQRQPWAESGKEDAGDVTEREGNIREYSWPDQLADWWK